MPYDVSNLGNVHNYLTQQQSQGSYVPTNAAGGLPSAGWDGWSGYNGGQQYSGAPTGQRQGGHGPGGYIFGSNPSTSTGGVQGATNQGSSSPYQSTSQYDSANGTPTRPTGSGAWMLQGGQWVTNPNVTAAPKMDPILQQVSNYGNKYGQDAYAFVNGINDPNTKISGAGSTADLLNSEGSLNNGAAWDADSILKLQNPNQGVDYWNNVLSQYQAGQHPTQPYIDLLTG